MDDQGRILVVGEEPRRLAAWVKWLGDAGYATEVCPGPSLAPCPRLGASSCPLRDACDAAVVEVQGPGDPFLYGETGPHACTRVPDDGTTVFVVDAGDQGSVGDRLSHPVNAVTLLDAVEGAIARRTARSV